MYKKSEFCLFRHKFEWKISRVYRYEIGFRVNDFEPITGYKDFDTEQEVMDTLIPTALDLMFKLRSKYITLYVTDKKANTCQAHSYDLKTIATTQLVVTRSEKVRL